jgi:hypothetical protein
MSLRPRRQFAARACASAALAVLIAGCGGGERVSGPRDPAAAEIVTSDLANFWRAYDAGGSATVFQREYLDRASAGLRDFIGRRALTASSLASMVRAYPRYFAAARAPMLALASEGRFPAIVRADFARLRDLYPDAVFPPMTLLVGRFSTAGTTGAAGLLIGTEFFVADASVPRDELGTWQQANVAGPDSLRFVVAHESIHIQQLRAGSNRGSAGTLLEQSLAEGAADFLGELVSGGTINARMYPWALAHEAELWAEFKASMDGTDVSRWLYNGGTGASSDRPSDLGYFVGYRIAKAFYDRQADARVAVREIIRSTNAKDLLARSGYDPR